MILITFSVALVSITAIIVNRFINYQNFIDYNGLALGIEVKILFAPMAKRLERKARSNAQKSLIRIHQVF